MKKKSLYVCGCQGQKNISDRSNVSLCSSRPISFRGTRSSANQVFRTSEFSQSGSEGLRIQPIRCFRSPALVQSDFFKLGVQPIRNFRPSTLVQSGFEELRVQPIR
jgi:hypothetical protein